ncbi:hypothetical protein CCOS865_00911 [Pseudomonas reidholzensis]|uniref:Uncharacterized protein n=1 Tax=Pseudomonas reidholzensis TaxID=1785162 RepID=A0A383RNT1_9PSED|nr:hypothetical protein CCOS865_00911 [Pseudomonas reidholzensis]
MSGYSVKEHPNVDALMRGQNKPVYQPSQESPCLCHYQLQMTAVTH